MQLLKDRILSDGKCLEGGILKVDHFINHQLDPSLMKAMSIEFIKLFASSEINKILTIEASGIAPAIILGYLLDLPVVFAKKMLPLQYKMLIQQLFIHLLKKRIIRLLSVKS